MSGRRSGIDRRTFLRRGIAAGALAGTGAAVWAATESGGPHPATPPNILVIIVDQMRFPQWYAPMNELPNIAAIRRGAVSFERHYTASNDCTPSRAALLTGLYTHQTGCMITGSSTLDPGFPTWGRMLREQGYSTWWYGKWHLSHGDRHWNATNGSRDLDRYGFGGGTFPSPDGAPGQGSRRDPQIVREFADWFAEEGANEPWCTTVSLVNPHDISWWYVWTDRIHGERVAAPTVAGMPPNFETPELLLARRKPRLQRSLQETSASGFGPVPFSGRRARQLWLDFANLYVKLQREVDRQIGHVMATLHSNPAVAANTVVVFTSDHGEYGASHGLRGKGAAVYEEGIRVPLLVKDPRGILTRSPGVPRTQLTSSVDVAPLLLTIAAGDAAWRRDGHYVHIAERLDLTRLLRDPRARGRDQVLHATDEIVTEFAVDLYDAPLHIVSVRTARAKYAVYSNWAPGGLEPLSLDQDSELYDYSTAAGRLEVDNTAGRSPLEGSLRAALETAVSSELAGPLPAHLEAARTRGFHDYFRTAKRDAVFAAVRRRQRARQLLRHLELPPIL
ncbi:MAG TPA: sulfatase-like hydrolase/transferase [Solirubrobacteraceae bacterium]